MRSFEECREVCKGLNTLFRDWYNCNIRYELDYVAGIYTLYKTVNDSERVVLSTRSIDELCTFCILLKDYTENAKELLKAYMVNS